jgi:hypothetical protein
MFVTISRHKKKDRVFGMKITLTHTFITISRHYITHSSEHSVPNSRLHLSDLPVFSLRFPVQNWLRTPVQNFLRQKVISEHLDACRVFGIKWYEMSVTRFLMATNSFPLLYPMCVHTHKYYVYERYKSINMTANWRLI